MNRDAVRAGIRVKITDLEELPSMFVKEEYLKVRKIGKTGEVVNRVASHGGDVWWVKHENGEVGAYCYDEFELV